jgi:putative SbcD/Mre11-related phosphoesterase
VEIEDLPFKIRKGVAAGFIDDYVVVGDLHLGFEEELNAIGYNINNKTEELVKEIISLGCRKLIMLGDVRSDFTEISPREGGILFTALSRLSNVFEEIVITKGNHDGGLSKLTSRLNNIRLVSEFVYKKIGFMHGHALPSKDMASAANTVCFGHIHPSIVVRDVNGVVYKKDCWSLFDLKLPKKKYGDSTLVYGVAFPKFNRYIGSTDTVKESGFMKYAKLTRRISTDTLIV